MAVDIGSLSAAEFLMLLNWEGDPPDDPAFDKFRMTPEEWRMMFPAAKFKTESEVLPDANPDDSPAAEAPQRPAAP
jgi:hypothetical protein